MLPGGSIALAHPAVDAETRLLVLPHPSSGAPTYFSTPAEGEHEMYELLVVRAEKPSARSWMVAARDAHAGGSVLADGALRALSPIDPVFVLLGLLAESDAERRFCPADDLAEAAAERHAQRRATEGSVRPWPDIAPFLLHPRMAAHLQRICDTQDELSASDGLVYRLSYDKISALLSDKCARLAQSAVHDAAPETLGRQVRKELADAQHASDAEIRAAQESVARRLVQSYLPPAVAGRWVS